MKMVRGWNAAILLMGLGIFCSPVLATWVTYQGDAAHTGYVPGTVDMTSPYLQWQTAAGQSAISGLAVGGSTVFATNTERFGSTPTFHALDQGSGSILWSKQYTQITSTSAPAYANGMVYFQTDGHTYGTGNYLHAYASRTGADVFDTSYSAQWETYLNPTPYSGNISAGGGYYGGMYSVNGASGQQKWFGSAPQYDGWTPAIDGTYAYSFTGSGDTTPIRGVLSIINLATGATAATVVDSTYGWTGYTMNSAVTLGANHDAFAITGGRLISWDIAFDATHTPHLGWSDTASFTGQPTLANGKLYAINGGALDVLDESTGNALWNWSPPSGSLATTMIATDNMLFVGTSTTTYAVDLASHTQMWSYPVAGIMALSDNTLYIGASSGSVYAIAVPEPASLLLLPLVGLGLLRRPISHHA